MRVSPDHIDELARSRLALATIPGTSKGRHLYLVSDRRLLARRRSMYQEIAATDAPDIAIKMLGGWISELASGLAGGVRRLQGWEQNAVLRALIHEHTPERSSPLAAIWDHPGTAASLARFVREIRSGDMQSLPDSLPEDAVALHSDYERVLAQQRMADGPALFRSLVQHLGTSSDLTWDVVTIEGFWHLDPPMVALFGALFKKATDPALLWAHDSDRPDLFAEQSELRDSLHALMPHVIAYDPDQARPALARGVFRSAGWDPTGGPRVRILRTKDRGQGREEIMACLKAQVRAGVPAGRCCVVFPTEESLAEGYAAYVRAGIPVDARPKRTLGATGIGRTFRAALLALERPSVERIVDLASAPYMTCWSSLLRLAKYCPAHFEGEEILEHLASVRRGFRHRMAGSRGISWEPIALLARWVAEVDLLEGAVREILDLFAQAPPAGAQDASQYLYDLLERFDVPGSLDGQLRAHRGWSAAGLTDLAAYRALKDGLLNRMGGLLTEVRPDMPRRVVLDAARELLDGTQVTIPATPPELSLRTESGRGVRLETPEGIGQETFHFVAVDDVSASAYPGPSRESWIGRLVREGVPAVESYREKNRRFYRVVRAAEQELLLVFPVHKEGETPVISPYVQEIAMAAPGILEDVSTDAQSPRIPATWQTARLALMRWARGDHPPGGELLEVLGRLADRGVEQWSPGPSTRELPAVLGENLLRGVAVEVERWFAAPGRWDGMLSPSAEEKVRARLNQKSTLSVSALETYAHCPFRFFASTILGLGEDFQLEERLSALRVGQLYHRVLEKYYRYMMPIFADARARSPKIEAHLPVLERALEQTLDDLRAGLEWISPVWWDSLRRRAQEQLVVLIREEDDCRQRVQGGSWQPWFVEHRFLIDLSALLDIQMACKGARVGISGTIDRVDIVEDPASDTPDSLLIFDYKLGKEPPTLDDARGGRDVQMPLYLMAVRHDFPDLRLLGGGYISMSGAHWRRGIYHPGAQSLLNLRERDTVEDPSAVLKQVAAHVQESWHNIHHGRFPPDPGRAQDCDYCPYPDLCRYSRDRIALQRSRSAVPGEEAT